MLASNLQLLMLAVDANRSAIAPPQACGRVDHSQNTWETKRRDQCECSGFARRVLALRAHCDETTTTNSLATIEIHSTLHADVRTAVGPSVREDAPAARAIQGANRQIMMHHVRDGQDSE